MKNQKPVSHQDHVMNMTSGAETPGYFIPESEQPATAPVDSQSDGSAKMDQVGEHTETIMCPKCEAQQEAVVVHTWPWYSYVHHCSCGYIIMESDWERVEPNDKMSLKKGE